MHYSGPGMSTSCSNDARDKALCGKHFVVCCGEIGDEGKCVNAAQFNNYFVSQLMILLLIASAYCILPISGVGRT